MKTTRKFPSTQMASRLAWGALFVLTVFSAIAFAAEPRQGKPAARSNIVFILSDDHRSDALGIAGHPHLQTPNLDRLAREGAWLRQAGVVTPLCAPSRAAFLTGLYGHTSGFRNNTGPWPARFPPSFLSVAHEAGYRTAFIGKKHVYNTDDPLPGVDRWVSFVNQGRFVDPEMNVDGTRGVIKGANGDLLTGFAADFIKDNRARPFALVVAYKEAHSPQQAPPRFDTLFERAEIALPPTFTEDLATKPAFFRDVTLTGRPPAGVTRDKYAVEKIKNYYRCIAALDDYVGRIRRALEEAGQLDNTILVFAGDNGYFLGDHGRFEKMTPHEESVRIPFIVRYPPVVPAGTISDELALNIDLAPTLYDLAGLQGPERLDGRSLKPIFAGRGRARGWRQEVFIEWQGREGAVPLGAPGHVGGRENPLSIPTWRALRTRTHKYAVYFNSDTAELYDLRADPRETRNLIADPSQRRLIEQMHRRLVAQARATGDPLLALLPKAPATKQ